MSETVKKGRTYLKRYYEEIVEELESCTKNFPKADSIEIPELNNQETGSLMQYLADHDVIDFYSERRVHANIYDMTDYNPEILDELKDELELD